MKFWNNLMTIQITVPVIFGDDLVSKQKRMLYTDLKDGFEIQWENISKSTINAVKTVYAGYLMNFLHDLIIIIMDKGNDQIFIQQNIRSMSRHPH